MFRYHIKIKLDLFNNYSKGAKLVGTYDVTDIFTREDIICLREDVTFSQCERSPCNSLKFI